jgi:hypothetical protein
MKTVFRIQIRSQSRRIRMFLGLLDLDPDSNPSIRLQKNEEKPRFLLFCDFFDILSLRML